MKHIHRPRIYTEAKTLKFTKQQINTFATLKQHGVNVQHFIRQAVKEKIQREWPEIKERKNRTKIPF